MTEIIRPRTKRTCRSLWACFKSLFLLLRVQDFCLSVENTATWRLHQTYSHKDGKRLKDLVVGRIASNTVFTSLLLSTTIGVLFSPSDVATTMRDNLKSANPNIPIYKAIGHLMLVSIFVALFALISNFAAWMIIQSASTTNSRAIIGSTIGLFATYLPGILVFTSINLVTVYMLLWVYVLIPKNGYTAAVYTAIILFFYVLIVATYSSLGRLILNTSAMSKTAILDSEELDTMYAMDLQEELLKRAEGSMKRRTSIRTRYMPNNPDPEASSDPSTRQKMEEKV